MRYAKQSCEFIYCGKLPNRHVIRQENINQSLVEYAKQGKFVVRLKGGDPSVFGRVGEEAAELSKFDIPFEIIPGITSSIAAAAYAGIPVTHRDFSNSFTLRTGHVCTNNLKYDELMKLSLIERIEETCDGEFVSDHDEAKWKEGSHCRWRANCPA